MGLMSFLPGLVPELARTFDDVDAEAFEQYLPPCHSAQIFTFCKVTEAWCLNSLVKCKANVARVPMESQPNFSKLLSPTS